MGAVRFHHSPRRHRKPVTQVYEGTPPQKKPINYIKHRHDYTSGGGHSNWRNYKKNKTNSEGEKSIFTLGQWIKYIKRRIKNKLARASRQKNLK